MPVRIPLFVGCVLLCVGSGCATTLSTFQTADVTDFKQVEVEGATGFYANVGPVFGLAKEAIAEGTKIKQAHDAGEPYQPDEEAAQNLFTDAIALAVFLPGQNYQVAIRTGIWPDKMDLGFRYSMNAMRLDTKYQFLHTTFGDQTSDKDYKKGSFDMAIGLAGAKYLFSNPVFDALDYLQLNDFSRWDVEVPLYLSANFGEIFKVYASPKYVYSRTELDENLVNYSELLALTTGYDVALPDVVHSHFVGGTLGVMAGYKYAWIAAELTSGYTFCKPYLFGRYRDLGGATFYPAIGIVLRVP